MIETHAFPRSSGGGYDPAQSGMTLRDYFAGQALAGLCPRDGWTLGHPDTPGEIRRIAANARKLADALIAELKKEVTP